MTTWRRGLAACLALAAAACNSAPPRAGETPARLVNPTAETRAELERAVSEMLGGAPVTLAADALTQTSVLVLEGSRVRGPGSAPLGGREMRMPERFQLFTDGRRCVLVHGDERGRYELRRAQCIPEE